jgi:hypothetical protein
MTQHYEDEADDTEDSSNLLDAVVTWFRVYQVPFDKRVADVLCSAAIPLASSRFCKSRSARGVVFVIIEGEAGPADVVACRH